MCFRKIFPFFFFCFYGLFIAGQGRQSYYDGPYINFNEDSLEIRWVEEGLPHDTTIAKSAATTFNKNFLPFVDLANLKKAKKPKSSFKKVKKVAAISDIHGQFEIMIKLLKENNIADREGNWNFGKGHLVIVGDNFDRGDRVLDVLWYLYNLEKEAEKAGGKVHVLLGNHEMMVLNGDLRYLNKKYLYTSGVFTTRYDQFFAEGSVLGDWLATHNTMVKINDVIYVHGGISPELLTLEYSLKKLNNLFRDKIVRTPTEEVFKNQLYGFLYHTKGPLWYRGYFGEEALKTEVIDSMLTVLKAEKIVVGHTSQDKIKSIYNDKVIVVDCSIKLGKEGEILKYEKDNWYAGDMFGNVRNLDEEKASWTCLFQYLYDQPQRPQITFETSMNELIKNKKKEEYQAVNVTIQGSQETNDIAFHGRIRARGNIRKKVCRIPPIKVDFIKHELDSLHFLKLDKLKLVLPCKNNNPSQERLLKEYFLYEVYGLIDTNALRVRLVDVEFIEEGKKSKKYIGFLVEDEESFALRKNARIIEKGKVVSKILNQEAFHKMLFFQYMIANTDWSIANKHNIEFAMMNQSKEIISVPYDFDYSGFVGQPYAIPHESLPIDDVKDRYYFPYPMTEEEAEKTAAFYLSIEDDIMKLCEEATYMNSRSIYENKKFIESFYHYLKPTKRIKNIVVDK